MQEKRQLPAQELICINVDKVYDWVMKENTFTFPVTQAINFPTIPRDTPVAQLQAATLTCSVEPATTRPIVILRRENRRFNIDGQVVCLQLLTIRKNFTVTLTLTLPNGLSYNGGTFTVAGSEQVVMCAPDDTEVTVTYTELDCFVSSGTYQSSAPGTGTGTGLNITFSGLVIVVTVCQSIQSTYPVTVEFLADFCEPRAELAIGSCPLPAMPPQCPVIYPE